MKAIVQDRYGDSSVLHLADVPVPTIGADDVLVDVRATALNIGDTHLMTGLPLIVRPFVGLRGPRQRIRGMDVAGVVHSVGAAVTAYAPGDEVFGVVSAGLAEFARASAAKIAPKPASLTFEQAACLPTSGATALHALRDAGRLQPGQRVLVIGAAGGVGIFATQIARASGAHVTGVCSTSKVGFVKSLGADEVIDYTVTDITTLDARYDLILDLAGMRPIPSLRRILAPTGTLVLVGGEGGSRLLGGLTRSMLAPLRALGSKQRLVGFNSVTNASDLGSLAELAEAGKIAPVIDSVELAARVDGLAPSFLTNKRHGKRVIVG